MGEAHRTLNLSANSVRNAAPIPAPKVVIEPDQSSHIESNDLPIHGGARCDRVIADPTPLRNLFLEVHSMTTSFKNPKSVAIAAALVTATVATVAIADTAPLSATGSKRRVTAVTNTVTKTVTAPKVERKVEATNTWVPEPTESTIAEIKTYTEEPIKPYIPFIAAMTALDCNSNGTPDTTEISNGAMDWDNDQILDVCEYKMGDLNLNGVIDQQDVSILIGWWGIPNPLFGDLNGDNVVDANDLGIILGRFGAVTY
jgi:hypothetical protein